MGLEDWPDRARARDETVVVSDAGTPGAVPRFRGTDVTVELPDGPMTGAETVAPEPLEQDLRPEHHVHVFVVDGHAPILPARPGRG